MSELVVMCVLIIINDLKTSVYPEDFGTVFSKIIQNHTTFVIGDDS